MLKKILSYAFPAAGLCAFFAVQAYVVGFLLNVGVSKTIDSGPQGPVVRALLIDVFLMGLFGLQHSTMARQTFKKWLGRFIPEQFERSIYVILSSAAVAAVMFHWQPLKHPVWNLTHGSATTLLYGFFAAGCLMLGHSALVIDGADLLGFRQIGRSFGNAPLDPPAFTTPGLYRYIRHPMMTGTLLVFWATPVMSVGHALFAAVMTCYVVVGIFFEERDLITVYGERYRSYQQRVGRLLPSWKG